MTDIDRDLLQDGDFILETTEGIVEGDTAGSDRDSGGEQAIPEKAAVGRPTYVEADTMATGMMRFFSSLFSPVNLETPVEAKGLETPEHDFLRGNDAAIQVLDAIRLIGVHPLRTTVVASEYIHSGQTVIQDDDPRQVLGYQPDRLRALLFNTHASAVIFISGEANLTITDGFEIRAGQSLEIATRSAIYAIADTADSTLQYLVESEQ